MVRAADLAQRARVLRTVLEKNATKHVTVRKDQSVPKKTVFAFRINVLQRIGIVAAVTKQSVRLEVIREIATNTAHVQLVNNVTILLANALGNARQSWRVILFGKDQLVQIRIAHLGAGTLQHVTELAKNCVELIPVIHAKDTVLKKAWSFHVSTANNPISLVLIVEKRAASRAVSFAIGGTETSVSNVIKRTRFQRTHAY